MPKPNPTEMLFGDYRRKILGLLLARPDESFHVREVARQTAVPVGSLHRELRALADAGILSRTPVENQVRYQANRRCPIFEPLAGIFGRAARPYAANEAAPVPKAAEPAATYAAARADGSKRVRVLERLGVVWDDLAEFSRRHHLQKLSLFGSVTRADFRPDSDVDVLVEFLPKRHGSLFDIVHMRDELSAMFGGRKVDVVTPSVLKNAYRRKSIERDLQLVYAAG